MKDRYVSVDIYEKYPTNTPTARILRILAAFITGWERGNLTGADLWDQLQLPYENDRLWNRSTKS